MVEIIDTIKGAIDSLTDTKAEGAEAPGAKKGFLDKFKVAFENAGKAKDKGWLERIKIFGSTLLKEFFDIGEEQKEVTQKTQAEIDAAIQGTLKEAKDKITLPAEASEADKSAFDEALAIGVASKASLDAEHTGLADRAMAKIDAAANGKSSEKLTFDEVTTMSAMGLMTLCQLKDKYPNKESFISAVKKLQEVTSKTSLPLAKLLSANVLAIFKIDLDANEMAVAGVMEKFGMGLLGMGDFGPDDVKGAIGNLKKQPFENKDQTVAFFHDHIFTNTSANNVSAALIKINEMIGDGTSKLSVENLAELVFLVDGKDFAKLVTALVGPKNYLALQAAKS